MYNVYRSIMTVKIVITQRSEDGAQQHRSGAFMLSYVKYSTKHIMGPDKLSGPYDQNRAVSNMPR